MRRRLPIALTIAGSDSGGGAGIQADLKVFAALGVHGTSALTAVTAQNPKTVHEVHGIPPRMVAEQIEAVFAELAPQAIKTGMLFSAPIVKAIAETLGKHPYVPLVIDPVMVATSGAKLLSAAAIRAMVRDLFPRAALITPNRDEAELLLGQDLSTVDDLRSAARELHLRHGCAVVVKGGHLRRMKEAVDIFWDGSDEMVLRGRFVRGLKTHGTGCAFSAAITAHLALGRPLAGAVTNAKRFIGVAIADSVQIGSYTCLK